MREYVVEQHIGGESFISGGFKTWKKKDRLQKYVRGPTSAHNHAWSKCQA